jgi:mRNA-degrading endonuclease toxin of MazEF toxin-antitoxin module
MTLQPSEVVPIRIDFHQASGGKVRPAAVLLDSGDSDFVAAPIRSRPQASEFDIAIEGWHAAGLNTASTVRVPKLTVLAKHEIVRRLGELNASDRSLVAEVLRRAFSFER